MKKTYLQIVSGCMAVLLCVFLAACGSSGRMKPKAAGTETQSMASEDIFYTTNGSLASDVLYDAAPETEYDGKEIPASGSSVYRDHGVKLIRRANLTVQTTQFEQTVSALEQLVIRLDGYYENAELRGGTYYDQQSNRYGNYTVRIPASKYDEFMQQVDGLGYLARKNESSEDVGQTYHDIETRLKTQRTKQERLLALLRDAESMEDIIALENALTEVEYHIEQYTTDLNRYDALISYATVHLTVEEMIRIVDEPGAKAGLFARMKAGVISSAESLVNGVQSILVWFTYNLFGILFFAAAVVAGVFAGRRYIRNKREKKPADPEKNKDKRGGSA